MIGNGRNSFLGIDQKMFEKMSLNLKEERIGWCKKDMNGIEYMTFKNGRRNERERR